MCSLAVMRCCPEDQKIKLMWEHKLETEKEMPSEMLEQICTCLKVLANPTRLKIAYLLSKQDRCVCEIVYILNEKQNLVSHHLSVMKKNGVIDSYNNSKWKYYRLNIDISLILKMFGFE
jgi:DNA-binding transcriptional ArsR family regulator